jgi:hypothetical protein
VLEIYFQTSHNDDVSTPLLKLTKQVIFFKASSFGIVATRKNVVMIERSNPRMKLICPKGLPIGSPIEL